MLLARRRARASRLSIRVTYGGLVRTAGTTLSVSGDVADRLRRTIRSGELSPGDRLPPERELAFTLGVGRVSVREAIRVLSEEGYVAVRRGARGGTFVTNLEVPYRVWLERLQNRVGELDALLDLRIAVEGHAAYLAAGRRSKSDLEEMRESVLALSEAESRQSFRQADSQFHASVAGAGRSPKLADLAMRARGEFFVPTDTLLFQDQVDTSVSDHSKIIEAIEVQSPIDARDAMAEHIEHSRTHLHRVLRGSMLGRGREISRHAH